MLAEMQLVRAHNLFQPAQLGHHCRVDRAVNLDKRDGFAAFLAPPQMKSGDIDAMAPAKAAKITNETGLVIIAQI